MPKLRVALYGQNAHQIHNDLVNHPHAVVTAIAGVEERLLGGNYLGVPRFESLNKLLEFDEFDLISICSPMRSDQGDDIIRSLLAGKHVYTEKPAAMSEGELDRIVEVSNQNGLRFHEQIGVSLAQPYSTLRAIVQHGRLGNVVQVYAQKSYPWHEKRPQDERIDGGLTMQVGIYCTRFVEHVAGCRIQAISAHSTKLGNPESGGECRTAVSLLMDLTGGGVASGIANYLCPMPPFWPGWGYETLRIWGTEGFVESVNGGRSGCLSIRNQPVEQLEFGAPSTRFVDMVIEEIRSGVTLVPFTLEEELRPTRWAIRAKSQELS